VDADLVRAVLAGQKDVSAELTPVSVFYDDSPHAVDVRRRAGWLPEDQDDLESWLDGHRERVEAKGEQVVLHSVLREFQERPVASPEDDKVIVSACESTPYGISTDVKRQDRFWIKSQPYSLADMLANDDSVDQFVGGTVYQAFLSATNYHRWHSPVAGTIVRAFVQEGTYYSEADSEGADAVEPMSSQSYLAHVAARAVILIEADDPVIGLMAFVAVGMSEVSSCLIGPKVTPGYHVGKGEELGYFQYGGSTHCLVFRPGAIAEFALSAIPQPHDPRAPLMLVRSKLATASTAA
jgi:phosphatidylserine decarboxylase